MSERGGVLQCHEISETSLSIRWVSINKRYGMFLTVGSEAYGKNMSVHGSGGKDRLGIDKWPTAAVDARSCVCF